MWFANLLLPLALAAPPSEGEKLLLDAERQLLDAKSLRITFEIESKIDLFAKAVGTLEIIEGNRSRTEVKVNGVNKNEVDLKLVEVSDGTTNRLVVATANGKDDEGMRPEFQVPKSYSEYVRRSLMRHGLFDTGYRFSAVGRKGMRVDFEKLDPEKEFPWGKFKPVVKEKLGDREALRVEYRMTFLEDDEATTIIWVDAKTKLPLKRVLMGKDGDGKEVEKFIEVYKTIDLNPKLDPKLFVLPKEK